MSLFFSLTFDAKDNVWIIYGSDALD